MRNGKVSIHARVRRATWMKSGDGIIAAFQSTPAYGGRRQQLHRCTASRMFQSTPAYGGRPSSGGRYRARECVSIHARVRRATRVTRERRTSQVFQSTPAYGGRPSLSASNCRGVQVFQSTPAYGGRRYR